MGTCCQLDFSDEDDKMLDEARNSVNDLSPETYEECKDIIEQAREDYQRAIEETGRQDLAEEQSAKDEINEGYHKKLQESIELKVSENHHVLIKGFNASRINNEDTARIQALFPAIVNQATKEMVYTGKFPDSKMTERGEIEVTLESWDHKEGRAIGEFNKHASEFFLGKSEDELIPEERVLLQQEQMDTQLHWNFHTIYNILFTDEDRVEVERICQEGEKGWEGKISKYATEKAEQGRNDEVFCECGVKFMTKPDKLKDANKQMYELIGDRLARLSRLSEVLGLEIGGEK